MHEELHNNEKMTENHKGNLKKKPDANRPCKSNGRWLAEFHIDNKVFSPESIKK
jgi:hypothetical protein